MDLINANDDTHSLNIIGRFLLTTGSSVVYGLILKCESINEAETHRDYTTNHKSV